MMPDMLRAALVLSLVVPSQALVGYRFQDNRAKQRVVGANGEMSFRVRKGMERFSICISFFVNFNRYSNIVPIFDLRTGYTKLPFQRVFGKFALAVQIISLK